MTRDDLTADAGSGLRQLIAHAVLREQALAREMGLGATDAQFLTLLDVHDSLTPGDLAERTLLSTGTVTAALVRLEAGGNVRRSKDATDGRRVLVRATTRAETVVATHYRPLRDRLGRVLGRRSVADLRVITDFLADMIESPAPE